MAKKKGSKRGRMAKWTWWVLVLILVLPPVSILGGMLIYKYSLSSGEENTAEQADKSEEPAGAGASGKKQGERGPESPRKEPYTGPAYMDAWLSDDGKGNMDGHLKSIGGPVRSVRFDVQGQILRHNDPLPEFGKRMFPGDKPRVLRIDEESGLKLGKYWPATGWIRTPGRSRFGFYGARVGAWFEILFKGEKEPRRVIIGPPGQGTDLGEENRPFKVRVLPGSNTSWLEVTATYLQ